MEVAERSHVEVVVRVRPPRADGGRLCISGEGDSTVLTHDSGPERQGKALRFTFSRAFLWEQGGAAGASTTRDLYESVGRALLVQVLSGYHCSLLAYGQTGERLRRALERPRVLLVC